MSRLRFWRLSRSPWGAAMRANPIRFGLIMIIIIAIVVLRLHQEGPFKHGYQLHAEFATAGLHPKSPCAPASAWRRDLYQKGQKAGLVTIKSNPVGSRSLRRLPEDPPRIFLEGNWFIDMQPGSPSAPVLHSGATIPITQTADPVQLDQVLDAINTDTAENLQHFLIYYGEALTLQPNAAENAEQEPEARNLNAAQALNKTYRIAPPSLRGTAVVNQALGGTDPNDISKLIASIGKVTAALNVHEQQLSELIPNFNTFFAAFASQSSALRKLVAELPHNLRSIDEGLAALQSTFKPTQEFAHNIIPGVKQTNATVAALLPWIGSSKPRSARRTRRHRQQPRHLGAAARQARGRTGPVLRTDRQVQQMSDEGDHPGRQHEAAGRVGQLGRRRLQGVLVQPRGPERDRPELRRQRLAGQVPRR
jgi:hypothetical protein